MSQPKSAGGFHSLKYTYKTFKKLGFYKLSKAMLAKNTCKTCALGMGGQKGGMTNEQGKFPELCKKTLQAMKSDLQGEIPSTVFSQFSLNQLGNMSAHQIESLGRISYPLYADSESTHLSPLSWKEAFDKIESKMKRTDPQKSFFYFSGRSSNEAGFLLQILARQYGTNHVNNCSYYCHQASGVGLTQSIGSGTASVNIDDIDQADLFFLIGANPSSNHPRLLTSLMHLKRRGGQVIVINPTREPGLVKFKIPSDIISLFFGSKMASEYITPHAGGDLALFSGMAKFLIEKNKIDINFINNYTHQFHEFKKHIENLKWPDIIKSSGVSKNEIQHITNIYIRSEKTIFSWAMGITHHTHGVANVQSIINLALLRGMLGKSGAGLLPLRGHSNVQGIGTVGVTPKLKEEVFKNLSSIGLKIPETKGFDTMSCMDAAYKKEIDFAWCLGGNLYESNPDLNYAREALNSIGMLVYLNTTLNPGHFFGRGRETLILPVLARDEEPQKTTQESMFSFVRLSDGGKSRVREAKSEIEIITTLASKLFPQGAIKWSEMKLYKNIRTLISKTIPGLTQMAKLDKNQSEFTIPNRIFHTPYFKTPDQKAHFAIHPLPSALFNEEGELNMISARSEGQYNSIIYETEDAFRKIDRRDVILMNPHDMKKRKLKENQKVSILSTTGRMDHILVKSFQIRKGNTLMYYPESNILISRDLDPLSKTPGFKKTRIRIQI